MKETSITAVYKPLKLLAETKGEPLSIAALVAGIALAVDMALLALIGQMALALGLAAIYVLGMLLVMRASNIHLGGIEYIALSMGLIVILASLIGVMGGLALSAMVGLGWLFAIAFGYALYRWNRAESTRSIAPALMQASTSKIGAHEVIGEDLLRRVDIFRGLSSDQLALVAKHGYVAHFRQGDILGTQGGRGEVLYALLEGQAELLTSSPMGQLTVRIAGPGETLPLAVLIGDGTLLTNAVAFSHLRSLVFPRRQLLDLCSEHPDIGMQVFRAIAEILGNRYRSTLRRLTERMDRVVEQTELWANV